MLITKLHIFSLENTFVFIHGVSEYITNFLLCNKIITIILISFGPNLCQILKDKLIGNLIIFIIIPNELLNFLLIRLLKIDTNLAQRFQNKKKTFFI